MSNLYTKLLAIQKEIPAIKKDETNPHFKNTYFNINSLLEVLKPICHKHGLLIMQPLSHIENIPSIETTVLDPETGENVKTTTPLPSNPDPQKMGSAITYYRRYALTSLLCLESEDTDGEVIKPSITDRKADDFFREPFPSSSPSYEPIGNQDSGVQERVEYNKCEKCGKPCKKPFKICYPCKTAVK